MMFDFKDKIASIQEKRNQMLNALDSLKNEVLFYAEKELIEKFGSDHKYELHSNYIEEELIPYLILKDISVEIRMINNLFYHSNGSSYSVKWDPSFLLGQPTFCEPPIKLEDLKKFCEEFYDKYGFHITIFHHRF